MPAPSLDAIVSLCKRRGFIFPGSEIYGGLANTWDYGPLGAELKRKVKAHWWQTFVRSRTDMVGLDSSILMNPKVWEASGHLSAFADPLMECKNCNQRVRADHVLEERLGSGLAYSRIVSAVREAVGEEEPAAKAVPWHKLWKIRKQEGYDYLVLPFLISEDPKRISDYVNKKLDRIVLAPKGTGPFLCPTCGKSEWTAPKKFNLMFKTHQGVVEEDAALVYLRPETAQGIFVNFKNIVDTMRMRLPFGVAQIGKAFRNEITPGNFTFRTREFEQMEIEYFVDPADKTDHFGAWQKAVWEWYTGLGIEKKHLRIREHDKDELSHYSSKTIDIEYAFPWGWGELFGLADRGDFDLSQHQKFSSQDLGYTDPDDQKRKILPHVLEPSFGCDRTVLTLLLEAYTEEEVNGETRVVMKLDPKIAPVDVAILPLSKKEHLIKKAETLYKKLMQETDLSVDFDVTGSIGKRYRRQDEIGTPKCITVDFGTMGEDEKQGEKDTVTIRDRDTLKQERVSIDEIVARIGQQ